MGSNKGWECPRCGEIYGPSVEKCSNVDCKRTPGEISDTDLHDQLYAPSVTQFPDGTRGKRRHGGGDGEGSSGVT